LDSNVFLAEDMYHMFHLQTLEENIWYFRNTISYPEEMLNCINDLDNYPESYDFISKWRQWIPSDITDENFIYGREKDINISTNLKSINDKITRYKTLYVLNSLKMSISMSFDEYQKMHKFRKDDYFIDFNKVNIRSWEGPGMGLHLDTYESPVKFTIITYLNDDYEGGEIVFPNQGISLKPKAGSTLIFPTGEPYSHKVNPILSGKRYTFPVSIYDNLKRTDCLM
jgi:2OG-Fe(II) oxygenase superfamily